jgi:D-serine deaminase-like pyridoxal phosphate-dependent protein
MSETAARTAPTRSERAISSLATDTPELLVDLDALRTNVNRAAAIARDNGVALRPHTKTHKMLQVAHLQMDAGAAGLMVAKVGEAEILVDAGFRDILVGYPILGTRKLSRLALLAERATIAVSLDSVEVAEGLSRAALEHGVTIRLLLEVETGMRRIGVQPGAPAVEAAKRIAQLPATEFAGLLTIEGHAYMAATIEEARALTREACSTLAATAAEIRDAGVPVQTLSAGSSFTAKFAAEHGEITEIRPGTYVFNDRTQLEHGLITADDLAALVVATVVSRPTAEYAVLDAGTKALTSDQLIVADAPKTFGTLYGRDGWDLIRASEEHTIVSIPPGGKIEIGERVVIIPNHVCPAINLFETATIVEGGAVVDTWPVAARGKLR